MHVKGGREEGRKERRREGGKGGGREGRKEIAFKSLTYDKYIYTYI